MRDPARLSSDGWRRIGHHPDEPQTIQSWVFRRCFCGFVLVMTGDGEVWWLRARNTTQRIESLDDLYRALSTSCRYYKRPEERRSALNAELQAARRQIKELTTPKAAAAVPQPQPAPKPAAPQPTAKVGAPSVKPALRVHIPNYQPTTKRGARR